jgi:hypothetical protein
MIVKRKIQEAIKMLDKKKCTESGAILPFFHKQDEDRITSGSFFILTSQRLLEELNVNLHKGGILNA